MSRSVATPSVVVAIPTYRRQTSLARLLAALPAALEGVSGVRTVVLDNEPADATRDVVVGHAQAVPGLEYVASPAPGIAAVRNHAIRLLGDEDFVAFIDDDEIPPRRWLHDLLDAQRRFAADVIVGPVRPVLEGGGSPSGHTFDQPEFAPGTVLPFCATNNTLVSAGVFTRVPEGFSEAFSMTGGSDTHFFFRATRAGCRIVWTDTPIVEEPVTPSRDSTRWLLSRAYRVGANRSSIEIDVLGEGKLRLKPWAATRVAKGFGAVVVGCFVAVGGAVVRERARRLHGMQLVAGGLGTLGGCFGLTGAEYARR